MAIQMSDRVNFTAKNTNRSIRKVPFIIINGSIHTENIILTYMHLIAELQDTWIKKMTKL